MSRTSVLMACVALVAAAGIVEAGTIHVGSEYMYAENLVIATPGAATATNISFGNHVVGPGGPDLGGNATYRRPIVRFDRGEFASIAGQTVVSATLHFMVTDDFTEGAESYSSEVRLFTTDETSLDFSNLNTFAALSGDGGAYGVVGTANFVHGVTGPMTLGFSPSALVALQNAINGSANTIGISFREFVGDDLLDEFVLGYPTANMSLDVTTAAVPLPSAAWMGLGLLFAAGLVRSTRRR